MSDPRMSGVQGWGQVVLGWREAAEERSRIGLVREENDENDDLHEKLIRNCDLCVKHAEISSI